MKRVIVVLAFLLGGFSVVEARLFDETSAVQAAEQFVSRNGYSDVQPSPEELTYEAIERSTDTKNLLRVRHDTLEPRAYGITHQRKGGVAGWTVVFRRKYQSSSSTGRAVTMNEDGSNIRMEHVDIMLRKVDKIFGK